ncbi:MAG TPA: Lsr2 family protein [Mycobacteriales bacterium]|nr:Lsr2 family protein [Mycobacteriales bacterium]
MAQLVQVTIVCDVHGDETPGTETVGFALDGASYEIDVCNSHAAKLRDALAPYIAAGRRAGRPSAGSTGRRRRGPRRSGSGVDPAAVRAWAKANHVKVSERGRISSTVLEQYAARKR